MYWSLLKGVEERGLICLPRLAELQRNQFRQLNLHIVKKKSIVNFSPFGVALQVVEEILIFVFESDEGSLYNCVFW